MSGQLELYDGLGRDGKKGIQVTIEVVRKSRSVTDRVMRLIYLCRVGESSLPKRRSR